MGSVRDLGSIFQKAGEFDASRVFAPFLLDAPADLVSWPVPPLKAKYTEAALVPKKNWGISSTFRVFFQYFVVLVPSQNTV